MIHYFTYYSFDEGYQKLYLGHENDHVNRAYRLPYLEDDKEEAKESCDVALQEKVKRQEALPKIHRVTYKNTYGWPNDQYISSGAYSLIYSHCGGDKFIVAKRGIPGCDKDIYGRTTPFLLAFICDDATDLPRMNRLTVWMANHPNETDNALSQFLHYDSKENGLCFEKALLEEWMDKITGTEGTTRLKLTCGQEVNISGQRNDVALLIVSSGLTKKDAKTDLALGQKYSYVFLINEIEPCDDEELAQKYKQKICGQHGDIRIYLVAATAIVFIGCFIYMCSRH